VRHFEKQMRHSSFFVQKNLLTYTPLGYIILSSKNNIRKVQITRAVSPPEESAFRNIFFQRGEQP